MKLSKQILFSLILSIATMSYSFADQKDLCSNLEGSWTGKGKVRLFFLSCNYDAKINVGPGNPADTTISVTKSSGSFLCPKKVEYNVVGRCNDGFVEFKDDTLDVSGSVADDGKSAEFEGTIYAMYKKHPFEMSATKD